MSLMQPKWSRRLDVVVGHAVWVADGVQVFGGFVRAVDNDGHYTIHSDAGAMLCGVRRESLCLKWQLGSSPGAAAASVSPDAGVDDERRCRSNGVADDEGSGTSRPTSVHTPENVKRLAALDRS